jgi:hypothetical protein
MTTISNLYINQGSDFSTTVELSDGAGVPLDLTGYTAAAQIRKTYSSSSQTPFSVTFDSDRTSGKVTLDLTGTVTSTITAGLYVYDLLLTAGDSRKFRALEGSATIVPGVTR